ncbi:MAG: PHP domain-containing protein, partial [Treponema sp.]|nr:PHP domain-containing protein [Treponema sp.]
MNKQLAKINNPEADKDERLEALKVLEAERRGPVLSCQTSALDAGGNLREINNHIHTIYSFSPYTPAMAALKAREAGLAAAGSVDHDSAAAAEEMLAACACLGLGGCVGFEVRVSFKKGPRGKASPFAERKINNPDSAGLVYMTVQGIPSPQLPQVQAFLDPIRQERLERTRAMTASANSILREGGLEELDFTGDIREKSQFDRGGEITERHLLAAVAERFIGKYGKGPALVAGVKTLLGLEIPPKAAAFLEDGENPHYLFDLLGVLKSGFLPRIFIQPGDAECIPAQGVTEFARSVGAIPAYAYLGDVAESPTGDKRAEKFEDEYLEALFEELARLGFQAVTYMPPRNTPEQLRRLRSLCAAGGFMEISGVDINSSRQSFNCPEVLRPEFHHLLDTTWALIAHERLSSVETALGLFSPKNPLAGASLPARLKTYARAGR